MDKSFSRKRMTVLFAGLTALIWILCSCAAWAEEQEKRHYVENRVVSEPPESDTEDAAASEKKLTLMIYLCGSNLESSGGAATSDLYEIQHSFVNREKVNVVVAAGGSKEWKNTFSAQETAIYELGNFNAWNKAENLYADEDKGIPANMGEPSTLLALLDYAWENDPAEEYALIFWDHGGGPMSGVCWDMQWAGNNLSMQELCGALKESPFAEKKLSWVGFDACLMASLENAHMLAPYAGYMIASEETEPASGWNYSFLKNIESDADGAATGERIVDAYFDGAEDSGAGMTLSCVDLSRITELEGKLGLFFTRLSRQVNEKNFSALSNRRYRTREFGKAEEDDQHLDLVDLGDLVRNYASYAAAESGNLLDALDQFVVYSRSSIPQCNGITIYHPYYNKLHYEKLWKDTEQSVGIPASYNSYIQHFARIWMDSSLGKWENLSGIRAAGETGETQSFSFRLTEDQMANCAYAQLMVLEEIGREGAQIIETENSLTITQGSSEPGYAPVFVSAPVQPDENGVLTVPYSGRTLYVVDDRDEIVAGPLMYSVSDDGHIEIAVNYVDKRGETDEKTIYTLYECEPAAPGRNLPVLDQYVYDHAIGSYTNRRKVVPKDYSEVLFVREIRKPTYADGQLAGFRDWEKSDWKSGWHFDLPFEFHFRFFDSVLDNVPLYACFQISDTQSVEHSSEMIPVDTSLESPVTFVDDTYRDEQLQCTVSGRLVHAELSRFLELSVKITNLTDQNLEINLANGNIVANQVRSLRDFYKSNLPTYLDPGESVKEVFKFKDYTLSGLSEIDEIKIIMTCQERPPGSSIFDEGLGTVEKELIFTPQKLDVSAAAAGYDEVEPLAVFEEDGLSISLVSLQEDNEGNLKGILGVKNTTGKTYRQLFDSLIVNDDLVMDFDDLNDNGFLDGDSRIFVTLPEGTDTYLDFFASNDQHYWRVFDRKSGTAHLALTDVLGAEGLDEIYSLTIYEAQSREETYSADDSISHNSKVMLSLSAPFSYEKRTDTQNPDRVELCRIGDVEVSGESVLLADNTVLISFVLENYGDEDDVMEIYRWFFNNTRISDREKYLVPAGTKRRIFACYTDYNDEIAELSEVRILIRSEMESILDAGEIGIVFEEPYSMQSDPPREFAFADAEYTVSGLDLPESTGPFFVEDIICPDQMASCQREFTFELPEMLMREDSPSIEKVIVGIMRDLPDHSVVNWGKEETVFTDPIMQPLAWIRLAEDSDNPGRYSGMYSGLLLVPEKNPAKNFPLKKEGEANITDGAYILTEELHPYPLEVLDPEKDAWQYLLADLSIDIEYSPDGEGSASVESFAIKDSSGSPDGMASWPSGYFTRMLSGEQAWCLERNEDESLELVKLLYLTNQDLLLDGEPVSLELIPAEDYDTNIVILYGVLLSDGTAVFYEGGDY